METDNYFMGIGLRANLPIFSVTNQEIIREYPDFLPYSTQFWSVGYLDQGLFCSHHPNQYQEYHTD